MDANTILLAIIAITSVLIAYNTAVTAKNTRGYALKQRGYVQLLNKNFDEAEKIFQLLADSGGIKKNMGIYLKAYTLYSRNNVNDKNEADSLLEKVIRENLGGKEEACRWFQNSQNSKYLSLCQ